MNFFKKNRYTTLFFAIFFVMAVFCYIFEYHTKSSCPSTDGTGLITIFFLLGGIVTIFLTVRYVDRENLKKNKT